MIKTYGFYSQYMELPNSLILHKTLVCTEEEAYNELANFESQRIDYNNQLGPFPRMIEFFEEIA